VLFAVLALVLSYAGRSVLEAGPFADRAVATLKSPAVQDDVADHLTDVVVRQGGGDLATVRPLVRAVAGTIVGSRSHLGIPLPRAQSAPPPLSPAGRVKRRRAP
jgi:hypothetical protein